MFQPRNYFFYHNTIVSFCNFNKTLSFLFISYSMVSYHLLYFIIKLPSVTYFYMLPAIPFYLFFHSSCISWMMDTTYLPSQDIFLSLPVCIPADSETSYIHSLSSVAFPFSKLLFAIAFIFHVSTQIGYLCRKFVQMILSLILLK